MSSYSSSELPLTPHSIPTFSDPSLISLGIVVSSLKAVQVEKCLSETGFDNVTDIW